MSFSDSEESATFIEEDKYFSDTNDQFGDGQGGAGVPDEYYEENFKRILGTSLQKSVAEAVAPLQSSILKMQKSFAKQKLHYKNAIKTGGKKASRKRKHCEVSNQNKGVAPSQTKVTEGDNIKQKMAKCFSVKTDISSGKPRAVIKSTVVHDTTSDTTSSTSGSSDSDDSIVPKKKGRLVVNNPVEVVKDKDKNLDDDVFVPEDIRHPKSNEWYTHDKVNDYLIERIRKPLDKEVRIRMRSECPRPFSADKIFDTPEIDAKIMTFAGRNARDLKRGIDRAWRGCQDRLLDTIGPLAKIMDLAEEAKTSGKPIDHAILSGWAQRALCFLGNANCSLSAERRKSILLKISPKMADLAINEPGGSAKGFLFGDEFVKEMAKYANSFQSMEKSKTSIQRILSNKVFDRAGRGRGRSTGRASFQSSRGNGSYRGTSQYGYSSYQAKSPFYPTRGRGQRGRRGFQRAIESTSGECKSDQLFRDRRSAKTVSSTVVGDFIGSVDITGLQRSSPRVYGVRTGTIKSSSTALVLGNGSVDDQHRDNDFTKEISHCEGGSPRARVCEQHLFSIKPTKDTSSYKPERAQSIHCLSTFQDGRDTSSQRPTPSERLYGQVGFEGRLPSGSYSSVSSEIFKIPVEHPTLAISMPPFRTILRTMGFYQTPETGREHITVARGSAHHIHRRHLIDGLFRRGTSDAYQEDGEIANGPGIFNKLRQIPFDPNAKITVSRISDRYSETNARTSVGKDKAHSQGDSVVFTERTAFNSPDSKDSGSAIIIHSSDISRTAVLQSSSTSEDTSSPSGAHLLSQNNTGCGFSGGIELVAPTHAGMERQGHLQLGSRFNYRIGCQQFRLGSSMRRVGNRRDMVLSRINPTHKLSRAVSGFIRHKIFGERQDSLLHTVEDGQRVSSPIHQQTRGNSFKSPSGSSKGLMAILSESQSSVDLAIYPRTSQCHSGLVVSESLGLQRLETSPSILSEDSSGLGAIPHRSVCIQVEQSNEQLLQLASGSESYGHRCVSTGLGNSVELRIPPFRNDSQSASNDSSDPGEGCSYYPLLDLPTLDSSSSGTFFGFSDSSSSPRRYSQQSSRSLSPVSAQPIPEPVGLETIGILRGMSLLSEQSRNFIDKSWSPGTRRIYESSWNQWSSWCLERDRDPFSADVSYIMNFLASKASEGYKYRSVNVFRSAISAGHVFVANLPVGEHPLICRLMKGIRLSNPPLPKYRSFWDVSIVLRYFLAWPDNDLLSLKQLSAKLACLLCLISCKRVSDVKALDISGQTSVPEGLSFDIKGRTKTNLHTIFYPAFQAYPRLCAVKCIMDYEDRTAIYRAYDQLILSVRKPFKPASAPTMARWIRWILGLTGVDTSIFGAHSLRGAMASKQRQVGVSLKDILQAADWSSDSIFKQFYCKPIEHTALAVIQRL